MEDLLWWDNLKEGEEYLFSFIKTDRVGSTKDRDHYPQHEVDERASEFRRIVENKVIDFNGKCIDWHGDGTTAFFYTLKPDSFLERSRILSQKSVECAMSIFGELVVKEELKAYMAVHIGRLPFNKRMGEINSHDLNMAGHAMNVCPEAGILLHEDVYGLLNGTLKDKFRYYGTSVKDNTPLFVYPKQRDYGKNKDSFLLIDKDPFDAKEQYINFIKKRYGILVPKGLRQERLLDISLFKIYSPLKVRQKEEMDIMPVDEILQQMGDIGPSSIQTEALSLDSITQFTGRINRPNIATPLISIPDLLAKEQHAVVLGPPGAGKSTLISWLALSCAEGSASITERLGLEGRLFPLPVSIGHLTQIWKENKKSTGMLETIIMYFKVLGVDISSFIEEELEKGRAFILLDGMDEVPSDIERREISGLIESFVQRYSRNRMVITSRIIGFPGISIAGGKKYIIEDLTIDEARPIIEKWMTAIEQARRGENEIAEKTGMEEARKLIETLENTPQLSPFIANPFLLTLTVLIHQTEARLPNYRIQLFERMMHTLVETWHQARSIGIKQPEEQKMDFRTEAIPVLAPLALHMHENYHSGTMGEKDLTEFVSKGLKNRGVSDPDVEKSTHEFLQRLKTGSGLLEEKGRGIWEFSHLSFEEYLCAVELVRNEQYNEYLAKYFYDPRWQEVLILVASELGITQSSTRRSTEYIKKILKGKGDEIREDILKKHVLFAGRCMANSANIDIDVMDNVVSSLLEFVFGNIKELRNHASKVLKEMLHLQRVMESVKEYILSRLKKEKTSFQKPAIRAIGLLCIKDAWAVEVVKGYLIDKDKELSQSALKAINQLNIWDNWIIETLKNRLFHEDAFERGRAISMMAFSGIKYDWILDAIKNGLNSKDIYENLCSVTAIGMLGLNEDWAIGTIKNGLINKYKEIRVLSIYAIGELGIKDDWAIEALKNGLDSKNKWVRRFSIFVISQLDIKEDWAIGAIQNGLADKNEQVRTFSIASIGQLGIKEDWAIGAIKNGLDDENEEIRGSSISAIGRLKIREDWAWDALKEGMKDTATKNSTYEALWALS